MQEDEETIIVKQDPMQEDEETIIVKQTENKIDSDAFYGEYHGHQPEHLRKLITEIRPKPIVFLAGDSSLDNKFWIQKNSNGIDPFPNPMKQDVHYHLLNEFQQQKLEFVPLNCAVEESTVNEHNLKKWEQDLVIQESIDQDDVLIVSIGGNDIALRPSMKTIFNMLLLIYFNSSKSIRYEPHACRGFKHFVNLFQVQVQRYIDSLISNKKPKVVMVCMIYYPCEIKEKSWSKRALSVLKYDKEPWKLQKIIQALFYHATSKIDIPGVRIVPVPLYEFMNPKRDEEYVARVEPSEIGGQKMAKGFVSKLRFALENSFKKE